MRRLTLALSLVAAGLGLATGAEAQSRRQGIVIEVKPRSWLDAGPVVPVGSKQNYVYDTQIFADNQHFGSRSGNFGLLPDRFSSGRGFAFESPIFFRD